MTVSADALDAAIDELRARRPGAAVDDRVLARMAEVLADPVSQSWMDAAGLLDGDSCGYPVEGGYYDVKSDLGSTPATADEAVRERVLARMVQDWADDYVLTGRARLDRPWRAHLNAEPSA